MIGGRNDQAMGSAITPILIMSFEICALLDDTLVIAKVRATHRLEMRRSFLMEASSGQAATTGRRLQFFSQKDL